MKNYGAQERQEEIWSEFLAQMIIYSHFKTEFWCKHAVQNKEYGVRRKTVSDIRKTESDPQNAYSVLIQGGTSRFAKDGSRKNEVNIGICNENYVKQRVSSANVRGVEIKSSTVKKAKHVQGGPKVGTQ